jgi:hypothetical protein
MHTWTQDSGPTLGKSRVIRRRQSGRKFFLRRVKDLALLMVDEVFEKKHAFQF